MSASIRAVRTVPMQHPEPSPTLRIVGHCPRRTGPTLASITGAGLDRLAEALTHLGGVRRLFLDPIGAPGTQFLTEAWRVVLSRPSASAPQRPARSV